MTKVIYYVVTKDGERVFTKSYQQALDIKAEGGRIIKMIYKPMTMEEITKDFKDFV